MRGRDCARVSICIFFEGTRGNIFHIFRASEKEINSITFNSLRRLYSNISFTEIPTTTSVQSIFQEVRAAFWKNSVIFFTKFWISNLILAPFLSFRSKKHYNCIVWSITIVIAISLASIMVYLIKTIGKLSFFFDRDLGVYLSNWIFAEFRELIII